MRWVKRLLVLIIGVFLSFKVSFAQEIKYSTPPSCKDHSIVCKNPNEVPTCFVLNPKIHIETTSSEKTNRYQPSCEDSLPTCIDIAQGGRLTGEGIVLECVEFVKCELGENNKLTANCSDGKLPKCLGSTNTPDCNSKSVCSGTVPVCDFIWEANLPVYNNPVPFAK